MKNILLISCFVIGSVYSQDYYNLNIQETGESTLIVLQSNIYSLDAGDEIGIFDMNGIINNNGDEGEILVGSGVWSNQQLEIIGIMGVDLSQFGGPILPGANTGNDIVIKIWKLNEQIEYIPFINIEAGSGTFNNLFTVISYLSCPDGQIEDECGICNGEGAIYECGCYDIPIGDCDCYSNIEDCSGDCGGNLEIDECGICGGDDSICSDCNGVPNGEAVLDECGICNGPGIIDGACDCDGNILDCLGICGGGTMIDDCGVCNGDSTMCDNVEAVLSFYNIGGELLINIDYAGYNQEEVCLSSVVISDTNGNSMETSVGSCISLSDNSGILPIYIKNSQAIAGIQFSISSIEIVNTSGGISAETDFLISFSASTILGFSISGDTIPPSGEFLGCLDFSACNYNPWATLDDNSCFYPESGYDCNGNCIEEDCTGECNGDAIIDECGICNGLGAIYECDDGTLACDELGCDDNDGGGGDGGGGGTGGECGDEEIFDCFGNCAPSAWLGDGYCDESMIDYNCLEYAFDQGDCEIDFNLHISSILSSNCTIYCHSGDANYQNHLNLTSYEGLMNGGDSGPAVIPYYPEYSLIIQKLNGSAPGSQMPPDGSSFPENYISTISHWIAQGAVAPENNEEDGCPDELQIEDCLGDCVNATLLGDGNCDDGEEGEANFNCPQFLFDYTEGISYPDCPVGILEFGEFIYNDGQGTVEILMNCEFPVSDFEIQFSGLSLSGTNGGAAENSNFDILTSENYIEGNATEELYIPVNSGLLTILTFNELLSDQICFENSIITTSIGMSYEAILGDCLDVSELDVETLIPEYVDISSIYPNPFNPETKINYSVSESQEISLNIFDMNGRHIITLFENKFHAPGNYSYIFEAYNLSSGIYIVELKASNDIDSEKIILTK